MLKISHRGNIKGPVPEEENKPKYIFQALQQNYDCELDFWVLDQKFFLGHDEPRYEIDYEFFENNSAKLWIHCKNLAALDYLVSNSRNKNIFNFFWHENDKFTLTSKLFIWTYPNQPFKKSRILVNLGLPSGYITSGDIAGVCSDSISFY